jgi:nucleoside-diphosphate-sugar epimerase
MGKEPGVVRARRNGSGRSGGGGAVVAVVGAASSVGRAVAAGLAARTDVKRVVAIDRERGDLDGVTWRILDHLDPAIVGRLTGCDVVVHAGIDIGVTDDVAERGRRNLRGAQTVLTAAAAAGVGRVVVVTSAMVYGALDDNPIPLDDAAPLRASSDGGLISDLLEIEALCARAPLSHPGMAVTVVRPATLVGRGVDTVLTRHFESPRLLVVKGSNPAWQFCHLDDLAAAVELVVMDDLDGPLTVGCDGWLPQSDVEALTGRSSLELPPSLAFGAVERLHRLGITPAPASELRYVTHPWAVSSQRIRDAGWQPEYDNATALEALVEEVAGRHAVASRRIGKRETATLGAAGAAGAAAAVIGTAAAVRRARRRK